MAAKNAVGEIQWSVSYPSAFSQRDIMHCTKVWQDLLHELQSTTGINQIPPSIESETLRDESLAVAQYFADFEKRDLVYTTCIYLLDNISEISIWDRNKQISQCTVPLGIRDLLNQFLAIKPKVIKDWFDINLTDWQNPRDGEFNTKLDVWLRVESENWLENRRELMEENEDFQGLIQLTAIGLAGLYYYIGILLKVLHQQGKYTRQQITPIYLGGRGSQIIKWLDKKGQFDQHSEINELLSRMLSAGSGFEDTQQLTKLSSRLGDEVACGLLLNHTKLYELPKNNRDYLIAGEDFQVNGKLIKENLA